MLVFSLPLMLGLLVCLAAQAQAAGQPMFTLVKSGKPAATIVVAQKASKAALFAVQELQYHLRRITGTALPVVRDSQTVKGPVIAVGRSKYTDKIGLTDKSLKAQEYVVKISPGLLVLMGKDDLTPVPDYLVRTSGKFGTAISFDGKNSYVGVNNHGFIDSEGTMEAWIKMPAQTEQKDGTILRMDSPNPWTYIIVQRPMNTSAIQYIIYDGANASSIYSKELDEGWHHIMATHSNTSGKIELFVDGVSQGTGDQRVTFGKGTTMYVGGIPAAQGAEVGNGFKGLVDEVRISKVVRKPVPGGPSGSLAADADTTLLLKMDEVGQPENQARANTQGSPSAPDISQAPGYFTEQGTMYAVYEFLEKYCGVDWFAAGEINTMYPKKASLTVQGTGLRHIPSFRYRWIAVSPIYWPTKNDQVASNEVSLWMYRMKMGGEPFSCNHSFYGYYERFLKTHPEWFAQGYAEQPPQMCYSNQGFIDQVIKDANEYFSTGKSYPGATVNGDFFGLCPMDNMSWCQCAECQAKLNQAEMTNQQFSNGKVSNYWFEFVNKVAREVRKTHPDKYIASLAYSDYAYHPDKTKLEPNVAVMMCLHTRSWWCPSMEVNDMKVLNGWVSDEGKKRALYVWLYYCFPALSAQSGDYAMFPGFFVHTMAEQTRMYHKSGIKGMFLEHSCEFQQPYLADQLEMYINWKMCTDVNVNVKKLIDKFFTGYYGKAAQPMKKLYLDMEKTFSDPKNYPEFIQNSESHQHHSRQLTYENLATPERMAKYAKIILDARAAASTELEKQRVDNFDRALIQPLQQGLEKYQILKSSQKTKMPEPVVPKVESSNPGDPDSIDWSKALDMGAWQRNNGDVADRMINSRIAHDGAYLYMQLQDQAETARLVSNNQAWSGDDFELFFADSRGQPYRQLGVAPSGAFSVASYGEPVPEWTKVVKVKSTTTPELWTARLSIPLAELTSGAATNKKFYANFYRGGVGVSGQFAWIPAYSGSFHDLTRLGLFTLE